MDILFPELIDMIVLPMVLLLMYITDETDVNPIIKGALWFVIPTFSVRCVFLCDHVSGRIFFAAVTGLSILIACTILIVNDNKKYRGKVKRWIDSLFILVVFISVVILIIDYSNSKEILISLILSILGALVAFIFSAITKAIKSRKSTEEDL